MSNNSLKNRPDAANFLLEDYPLYNLNRTSATYISKMSDVLKSINMDQPRWRILMLLNDKNPSNVSELSRRSVTKLSTITRIIIRMEDKGLVKRTTCPVDARVTQVHLTKDGQALLDSLHNVASRIYERAFIGIDNQQIEDFMATLKHIRANLTDAL
jgi:MarR family transcriptional regulator, organic hydroperoxide resistance regulator